VKPSLSADRKRAAEIANQAEGLNEAGRDVPTGTPSPAAPTFMKRGREHRSKAEIFLSFNYPELKDLGKHFLTLSLATAVFLLTFVEKLLGPNASLNRVINACMVSLLVAIASAGSGLFFNYIAGAGASGAVIWGVGKRSFRALAIVTYILYMIAGSALFVAYALLTYSTMFRQP
jgi:hypothetical protein